MKFTLVDYNDISWQISMDEVHTILRMVIAFMLFTTINPLRVFRPFQEIKVIFRLLSWVQPEPQIKIFAPPLHLFRFTTSLAELVLR